MAYPDLTNREFDKLTVKKITFPEGRPKGARYWHCECECGGCIDVPTAKLTSGHTRSCGCILEGVGNKSNRWKGCGEIGNSVFNNIRKGAEKRNLIFSVSIEYLWNLFLKQNRKCALTGIELYFEKYNVADKEKNFRGNTASLDRINSDFGYVEGNVHWVHKDINQMKWDYDYLYFVKLCELITKKSTFKDKKTVLVTGSQGFLGSYLCQELLNNNYIVIGIDDYSKYGTIIRQHDINPHFLLEKFNIIENEFKFGDLIKLYKPDFIIALCAKIGGIKYFHDKPLDLLIANSRIDGKTFEEAIKAHQKGYLKRIVVISSSMVYENANIYPTPEDVICSPPNSTYGFSKLAIEYKALGAYEQYKLPYTIIRPFNCIGLGESSEKSEQELLEGNIESMLSHVLPDIVLKTIRSKGEVPINIFGDGNQIRCYTHGKDIARGIRMAMESDKAINQAFNISNAKSHTVLELAQLVWKEIYPEKPFKYICEKPYKYDVQKRIPDTRKAKDVLGFEATISLEETIKEIVEYFKPRISFLTKQDAVEM